MCFCTAFLQKLSFSIKKREREREKEKEMEKWSTTPTRMYKFIQASARKHFPSSIKVSIKVF